MPLRFLESLPAEPFAIEHLTTAEGDYQLPLNPRPYFRILRGFAREQEPTKTEI